MIATSCLIFSALLSGRYEMAPPTRVFTVSVSIALGVMEKLLPFDNKFFGLMSLTSKSCALLAAEGQLVVSRFCFFARRITFFWVLVVWKLMWSAF